MNTFSKRFGYANSATEVPISVREDAPHDFRGVLVELAYEYGWKPRPLRELVCRVLRERPDSSNWSEYPNIDGEIRNLVDDAEWYKVYDIVEAVYNAMTSNRHDDSATRFEVELNDYFVGHGIGWQLTNGQLQYRGSEGFNAVVKASQEAVAKSGHSTASVELHEALMDLSRRPVPDRTGAVQHAMASLECVARAVSGSKSTLGDVISANRHLVPKPLDVAIEKIWGFTSERGRHLLQGNEPTPE
ncbi:hypothetical protein RY831_26920 [Noviherbaspirillum sp. CPCC 100848]|uniref:HEPN AbiJ-N-terminal domain-containing protein n=1 Tax=Noviherbaspirillum album TaxID=3080276 RepID=A0ABU6JGK9_9BURK|nr:hypothetical protein [Noviherbaspirillum sp. CPCC 100848]MEC4722797.1 hypothetical protein [Noviherbaspirillum sp. CPCC 100848]